jgi:hypothetical protein
MRMLGFEAEASRSCGWQLRNLGRRNYQEPVELQPALLRGCLLNCEQICEGNLIGACMPWYSPLPRWEEPRVAQLAVPRYFLVVIKTPYSHGSCAGARAPQRNDCSGACFHFPGDLL